MEPISAGNKKFLTLTAHLLSAVRREVEDEDGEEADAHAGDDEVDSVEQGLAPHSHVEGDVKIGFITAGIIFHVPHRRHLQNVPLHRHVELRQVHPDLHLRPVVFLVDVAQVHLVPVVGPGTELHDAGLLVKGEVFHVHFARAMVDRRGFPFHFTRGV